MTTPKWSKRKPNNLDMGRKYKATEVKDTGTRSMTPTLSYEDYSWKITTEACRSLRN